MGTVVYQGLHESQLVEPRTQNILRLRLLSSPRSHYSSLPLKPRPLDSTASKLSDDIAKCQYEEISQKANTVPVVVHKSSNTATPDSGGWSFLQALDNSFDCAKESKKQSTYVHPLVKRTSSALSEKSLELCTESLGSESGSDIIEDSIFISSSVVSETNPITTSYEGNSPTREQKIMKPRQVFGANNTKASSRSFPPPLTTMSGSKSIQVRPHREDGRLIIEAIENPSTQAYFHAERSHGRLRLSFVRAYFTSIFDSANVTSSEDNNEEEENENDVVNYDADQEYEEQQQQEGEETEDEVDEEEMNCKNMEVGDEMGSMDEFQRPSRCKQGELENHRELISNWEHLCVATT